MLTLSRPRRPLALALAGVLVWWAASCVAAAASLIFAAPAAAHVSLLKITPEPGAVLTTAPTEVVLEFDEPVSSTFATVVVDNGAGAGVTRGKLTVLGSKVTQPLRTALASGRYRVAYRVVSKDGHPVSGESGFTLAVAPGTGSATSTPRPAASGSPTSDPPSSSATARPLSGSSPPADRGWWRRHGKPASGAAALFAAGVGTVLWRRQRR